MKITIIDNTPTRSSKIKNGLSVLTNVEVNVIQEISNIELIPSFKSLLYLVHKGNDNVAEFINSLIVKDDSCYIVIFSGSGIKQPVMNINLSERIFNVKQVLNTGDESNVIELLNGVIKILSTFSSAPIQLEKLTALFGFDIRLEELLLPFIIADPTKKDKGLKVAKVTLQEYVDTLINSINN